MTSSCPDARFVPVEFHGRAKFIAAVDAALAAGDQHAVTASLRTALCQLIRDADVRLPDCVYAPLEDHYARREIYRSPEHGYSVVAMTWGPGQGTPVHDHSGLWQTIDTPEAAGKLAGLGYHAADETARQLATVRHSQRYQQLPPKNRHRFDSLIPALIEVAASHGNPDETLMRILGLMEAISRRSSYLALLSEYPQTLRRVASLCSSSPWVSNYLTRHPILLDELLDARVLYAEPDWPALRRTPGRPPGCGRVEPRTLRNASPGLCGVSVGTAAAARRYLRVGLQWRGMDNLDRRSGMGVAARAEQGVRVARNGTCPRSCTGRAASGRPVSGGV